MKMNLNCIIQIIITFPLAESALVVAAFASWQQLPSCLQQLQFLNSTLTTGLDLSVTHWAPFIATGFLATLAGATLGT